MKMTTVKRSSIGGKSSTAWYKQMMITKRNDEDKKGKSDCYGNRFLTTINVFGSAGPIRFVVNGEDTAGAVVETALMIYARQKRLPVLGSDVNSFLLYPNNAEFDALEASEAIGSRKGCRNFVLCRKPQTSPCATGGRSEQIPEGKGGRRWRSWLQKSLSLKILPR